LDSLSLEYFLIVMMCEFAKYTDLPKSVNRHSILHGADLEFGTRLNSIIVILVFDFFVNQVYNTTVYSE
jgi:hypothetical protein